MSTVTKRELNQHTAQVLEQVTPTHEVVVTERGEPRWRVTAYTEPAAGLSRLIREGRYTPPSASPAPWHDGGPEYTDAQVDALLDELKGEH
ncbi:type II toxin-antitoxin system Phd/YefM family antitoxin [Cellulomonas uda]|uniref:Antitoxin n=1 Tax=Cellulomonas uda TaxID=1714 RepID=A0A4Y3KI84_CELUD|nr:type II toxin-antitoxin system prevent-host-death family antitoxin [Cellulomonas uda]NII67711.1 prevent-host-death family protein [Cellulomonas uda]GEA82708.1 hypothetical protein CUD01_31520 [Cellulomonas uda]